MGRDQTVRRIRVGRRFTNLLENLQNNSCVVFKPSTNADLSNLKRLSKDINNMACHGNFTVSFDNISKQGVIVVNGMQIKKYKHAKSVFDIF